MPLSVSLWVRSGDTFRWGTFHTKSLPHEFRGATSYPWECRRTSCSRDPIREVCIELGNTSRLFEHYDRITNHFGVCCELMSWTNRPLVCLPPFWHFGMQSRVRPSDFPNSDVNRSVLCWVFTSRRACRPQR